MAETFLVNTSTSKKDQYENALVQLQHLTEDETDVTANLANIMASVVATAFVLETLGSAGIAVVTGVMTLLIMVFAEVLPKSYALSHADPVSADALREGVVCLPQLGVDERLGRLEEAVLHAGEVRGALLPPVERLRESDAPVQLALGTPHRFPGVRGHGEVTTR